MQLAYVLAQETAEHEPNPILPASNELIWGTVAFLILLFLMYRTVFPSINQAYKDRRANIEGKLEKAERDREEAEQLLEQYRRRLRDAEDETQRILDEARANAERVRRDLLARPRPTPAASSTGPARPSGPSATRPSASSATRSARSPSSWPPGWSATRWTATASSGWSTSTSRSSAPRPRPAP